MLEALPIGPKVVPFWGSYLEFYRVIPKRNYFGAYGYSVLNKGGLNAWNRVPVMKELNLDLQYPTFKLFGFL